MRGILALLIACGFRPGEWQTARSAAGETRPTANRPTPAASAQGPGTTLGIQGTAFTLNGKPTFLYGLSYYGGLGASEATWKADLDRMPQNGFNWLRVWATWSAFGSDVSAVDSEGHPREPYLSRLKALVSECDRRGLIVDVTLTRGAGTTAQSGLPSFPAHQRAVETLLAALKPWRNWYLDLSNERNIGDKRHTSIADLARLRQAVKRLAPERLVTASHGGDMTREDVRAYLLDAGLDFLCPHRPRDPDSPGQTEAKTRELRRWVRELGRAVPIHYQEPFRRGYGVWQPRAEDFAADLQGAQSGGAAGWCFHNGATRSAQDGRPRRSFDLRDGPLFAQLDTEERRFVQEARPGSPKEKQNR
ncbi:MAG TPA: hypothetical protein VFB21_02730 [Chthonomonadaceae bacterium]|nr:hypothetical protein [Chthonomonadaceae bacterium]